MGIFSSSPVYRYTEIGAGLYFIVASLLVASLHVWWMGIGFILEPDLIIYNASHIKMTGGHFVSSFPVYGYTAIGANSTHLYI